MYQKILNGLQDFFGISRKEARGALVMMVCCAIMIWAPFFFRRWILPFVPAGSPPPERRVLDSIALLLEKQQQTKYRPRARAAANGPTAFKPEQIKLVSFDPNTASERELRGVGIPAFIARRIEKFRSKGGKFRQNEDLMKIYDFPPELYARLERYISIKDQKPVFEGIQIKSSKTNSQTPARQEFKSSIQVFDINQCDTTALIRLKGIGTKLAQRILKFRDGLGGFHSADQFSEVYGLDSLALSELRRNAKVLSNVKKISVNAATGEELGRHPYLRNRKQVQVLVNYRTQHGPFRSLEELRNVKVLDEATIQKIGPYLSF
ncbi:DNA uptake protein ComE [Dyadobacter soli]|uniref:DNA uptake protein ComE n=1 Tax=Dyadobacter soli TaxID=659014 RepID=A0A1G7HK35_9BACT|nr:helix-hairpin-helix domain-containing protein [Dyadobacter soli]SDF00731.1 DNA uptake protein ComE [Dyadobacter soli]